MASIFPSDIEQPGDTTSSSDELTTLIALRDGLSKAYSVYHSVHWSKANTNRTAFGEIDFVVMNSAGELLVIEQKNGALAETRQGLEKHYGMKRKLVDSQIQRNIGYFRSKYSRQHQGMPGLSIDYLIYCPDYCVIDVNAAGVDMSRTVDEATKTELVERIQQLLGPGDEEADLTDKLHKFLLNSFRIMPDVNAYKSNQERVYRHMLTGLSEVIESLEFEPFRLRVVGTAGSGKTQVTMQFCERMVAQGRRPLLLCYNRPLADKLRAIANEHVVVDTYLGFCEQMAETLAIPVDLSKANEPGFWQDVQERLVAADLDGAPKFDCLLVDEGQDFSVEWYDILQLFLTEDATQLWLEDPLQNLRNNEPVPLPDFVTYRETANFRSPSLIASFIKHTLQSEFEQRNTLPGLGVEMFSYDKPIDLQRILAHRITEIVKAGFTHEDIVIVSCRGMQSTAMGETDKIGRYPIRRFTGKYDEHKNQIYTEGKIRFETIYRFKGQQAPIIILMDLDDTIERNDTSAAVLYCAMTRATVRLELVVQEDCPWIDVFQENL